VQNPTVKNRETIALGASAFMRLALPVYSLSRARQAFVREPHLARYRKVSREKREGGERLLQKAFRFQIVRPIQDQGDPAPGQCTMKITETTQFPRLGALCALCG
jgi:hypothetical protein